MMNQMKRVMPLMVILAVLIITTISSFAAYPEKIAVSEQLRGYDVYEKVYMNGMLVSTKFLPAPQSVYFSKTVTTGVFYAGMIQRYRTGTPFTSTVSIAGVSNGYRIIEYTPVYYKGELQRCY